jgi:hypothetical protein
MANATLIHDDDMLGIDADSSSDDSMLDERSDFETRDQCRFRGSMCGERRGIKPDGSLYRLCEAHRRHQSLMQRKKQQRQRLLQTLLNALQPESTGAASRVRTRHRPRLALLGSQQTLILGIVLSEHGAIGRAARQDQSQ